MSKGSDAVRSGFTQGIAYVLGLLADDWDQPTIAASIWEESGFRNSDTRIACEYDVRKLRKAVPGLRKGIER